MYGGLLSIRSAFCENGGLTDNKSCRMRFTLA